MRVTQFAFAASLLASLASVACGHDAPPPPAAPVPETTPPQTTSAATPAKTDNLKVSPDLKAACNIADTPQTPKFDFDSSSLTANDRSLLDQIGTCLTTGPLKGKSVQLTGRADNRGEQEYNMNLGSTRASSAVEYLQKLGVDSAHMKSTSRGALDATGKDEAGWAADRRVDVSLLK